MTMSQLTKHRTYEKKIKIAELKVLKVLHRIEALKLKDSYIARLDVKNLWGNRMRKPSSVFYYVAAVTVLCFAYWIYSEISTERCQLELPVPKTVFRPPVDCSGCEEVREVHRLANTSALEFEAQYAYSTQPVIVSDAATHWQAIQTFNYNFFKNFYKNNKMEKRINDCFYFAYKSGLNSLQEVFNMEERRANLSGDPWYVGWSTCFEEEIRLLRSYYTRPYFLPRTAESDMVDWLFMGGPGQGAHMHVDSVKHMSWQAQIRGHKRWDLAPPPECLYRCKWISFTVAPGDILVVDTNWWYHRTSVLPGDISITIGAEYD